MAPGFRVQVVANQLTRPRSLHFDSEGALLVVEQSQGVKRIRLAGEGSCVRQEGAIQNVTDNDNVSRCALVLMTSPAICRELTAIS